jgi:hypothetical protein
MFVYTSKPTVTVGFFIGAHFKTAKRGLSVSASLFNREGMEPLPYKDF